MNIGGISMPVDRKAELEKMKVKFEPLKRSKNTSQIAKITPQVEDILRRKIAGQKQKDIAKDIGLSLTRMSSIVNSPLFKEKELQMKNEINERFMDKMSSDPVQNLFTNASPDAAAIIIDIMKNAQEARIKKDAANDVLGYAGYSQKATEDKSTKIYIDQSIKNDIYAAINASDLDKELFKEIIDVKEVEDAETD